MLSGFQRGREYLKKSVQLAVLCESCREADYDKFWSRACSYVSQANECIPENELANLTKFELDMLTSRRPSVPQFSFFDNDNTNPTERMSTHHMLNPPPSFKQLQKQITDLEKEKDQLEKYRELSEKLKHEYIELEKSQASYQSRLREEQCELQLEMKKMLFEIEIIPELKRDVYEMESEMLRMRDRIRLLCAKHREEMTSMYTEMDASNIDRELLAINLHQTQQQLLTLGGEKKTLEDQIGHYQQAFETLSPHLDDTQRLLLSELFADS
jgi:hypothetical protein